MRITGGTYRGRVITCPPGVIRPAMDRMRESVFAVLGDMDGLSWADLFSGSGVVGIEAASRGAAPVTFVERDRKKLPVLRRNLSIVQEPTKIVSMPAERFIRSCREAFHIVFLDPPFDYREKQRLLHLISDAGILMDEGLALMHYPAEDALPDTVGSLTCVDTRSYGRSRVVFYRMNAGGGTPT